MNCTFTPNDWLENFRMSQNTFTYLCNELRQGIQKKDSNAQGNIGGAKSCCYFVAVGDNCRLSDHWAPFWHLQGSNVCYCKRCVHCHSAGTATKVP